MDAKEAARVKDDFDRNNVPPPPELQAQIDAALTPIAETAQPIKTIQATKTPDQVIDIPEPPPPQPSEKAQAFIEQRKEPAKSIEIPGRPIPTANISKGDVSTFSKESKGATDKTTPLTYLPKDIQPQRKAFWNSDTNTYVMKHSFDGESWIEDEPRWWETIKEGVGQISANPYVQVAGIALTLGMAAYSRTPPEFNKLSKLATKAGNANTAVETEASIQKGYIGVTRELPMASNKLQQALQKSYNADNAFLNELGKTKNVDLANLYKFELKSGMDGITKNVVDIGAEQERVTNAWNRLSKLTYYTGKLTPSQEKSNLNYLKELDKLQVAQGKLAKALSDSDSVLAPRYRPAPLPEIGYDAPPAAEIKAKQPKLDPGEDSRGYAKVKKAFDEWLANEKTKTQFWERGGVAVAEKPITKTPVAPEKPITTPEPKPATPTPTPATKPTPQATPTPLKLPDKTRATPKETPKKYETPDQERERIRREQEYAQEQGQEQEAVTSRPIDTTLPTRFTVPNKFTIPTTTPTEDTTPATTPTTIVTPTITTTTTTTPTTTPITPTEVKPTFKPETPTKQTTQTIITPITPPQKPGPTPPTKPPTPPTRIIPIPRLMPGMSDKEKREVIEKAGGAFTWQQGELNNKKVHHVVVAPFEQSDKTTVLGKPPKGAKQVSGKGQSKATLKLLYGDGPKKPTKYEGGAIDPVVRSTGWRRVQIRFVPDRDIVGQSNVKSVRSWNPNRQRDPHTFVFAGRVYKDNLR